MPTEFTIAVSTTSDLRHYTTNRWGWIIRGPASGYNINQLFAAYVRRDIAFTVHHVDCK